MGKKEGFDHDPSEGSSSVSEKEFDGLCQLCQIEIDTKDKDSYQKEIEQILVHARQLAEVDTTGVDPCYHVLLEVINVMGEDEPHHDLDTEEFLSNAPDRLGTWVRVPRLLQE